MWAPEAVAMVIEALNDIGSPYFVTGSVASNAYTVPRGTIDADFVLEVRGDEISRLRQRLKDQFVIEEQLAFETVTGKVQRKFRHRETQFLVEVFEARLDDPHERSRFERRVTQRFAGRPTYYPTAERRIVPIVLPSCDLNGVRWIGPTSNVGAANTARSTFSRVARKKLGNLLTKAMRHEKNDVHSSRCCSRIVDATPSNKRT